MAYQQKDLQGSLFVNQQKQNERQPDWTGSIVINNVYYRLSGWARTPQNGGNQFISIVAELPQQRQYAPQQGGYQQQRQQQGFQQTGQFPNQPIQRQTTAQQNVPTQQNDLPGDNLPF